MFKIILKNQPNFSFSDQMMRERFDYNLPFVFTRRW